MSRMGELSQSPRRKRFCKHKSYALHVHIYTYARQNENKYISQSISNTIMNNCMRLDEEHMPLKVGLILNQCM